MPEPTTAGALSAQDMAALRATAETLADQPEAFDRLMAAAITERLLAALAQAERERDVYCRALQRIAAGQCESGMVTACQSIASDALAAAPPPEEEASRE